MKRKSIFWLLFLTIACFTSSSCQTMKYGHPGTKLEKEIVGKNYDKNGVKFSYPKDWQIVEDEISEKGGILILIADAPFCFVSIKIYSSEISMDLIKGAKYFDKKLQAKMPTGKSFEDRASSVSRNFQGQNREGVRLKSSFSNSDANIPSTTDYFLIERQKSKTLIIISADDADWKAADKEFQLILDTLKFE